MIPVTILTGFLGSGKTTLLNRILKEKHGQRIAVIENEFGEAGIDNQLLIQEEGERIVEMNNGCICCTVRGDLVRILGDLADRRRANQLKFSRVIIETTGLADPAPVAQTFFVEEAIAAEYRLDAIITVVDAVHAMTQLDEHHEAQEQVGFADRILISKTDLVTDVESVLALSTRLRQMNPRAPITQVHFGETDIKQLLDLQAFDLESILEIEPDFMTDVSHEHDDEITSFVYRDKRPFKFEDIQFLFGGLIETYGKDLLRFKGVLNIAGRPDRVLLQGVHMIMGDCAGAPWQEGEERESTLVFIGRNLPKDIFMRGFDMCHE